MKADVEKLKRARELIARPGGWTQKTFAKTKAGRTIGPECGGAVCWCAEGALFAVNADYYEFKALADAAGVEFIPVWNDEPSRTQAEVIAAFDKAITLAEAQP